MFTNSIFSRRLVDIVERVPPQVATLQESYHISGAAELTVQKAWGYGRAAATDQRPHMERRAGFSELDLRHLPCTQTLIYLRPRKASTRIFPLREPNSD
ncbi:hypothetical protein E2C01_040245 [Portunus trituberculatus]|uniref:Uncharacterized protein n=1 Tax=Portunus trituberculatus TaxID=210409 RepID=A0A5B7FM13_PORTR|nr:hypothetical protein [Portunus trituberculatus]